MMDLLGWFFIGAIIGGETLLFRKLARRWHDRRWVRWFGHRWLFLPVAYLAAGVLPPHTWWALLALMAWSIGLGWSFANEVHDDHLCEECAAAWPMDAPEQAERQRRWLWFRHNTWKVLIPLVLLAFMLGWREWWPPLLGVAGVVIVVTLVERAKRLHDALALWCPYCGPDDEGDDDDVPAPEPEPDERCRS